MTPRAGFTLIEVVLALGLLLLGATVILGLLSFGAALARTAELRGLGADAMEAVVADLEEGLFPLDEDGTAGEPVPVRARAVSGHFGLVWSATAVPNPAGARGDGPLEYRVDVEIAWKGGAGRRAHRFSTLLLREVPFGERMRRALAPRPEEPAPDTTGARAGGTTP